MAAPWDIPPFRVHGDETADDTYKMVGCALSEWEHLEYTLAHLYAEMAGKPAQIVALRYYGAPAVGKEGAVGRIFRDRIAGLEQIAEAFFVNNPRQNHEGEFSRIVDAAKRLADRRNEIAHGIVRPIQWMQQTPEDDGHPRKAEFALVPPLYTKAKFDDKNRPLYIYTTTELERFSRAFFDLSREVVLLRLRFSRIRRSSPDMYHQP